MYMKIVIATPLYPPEIGGPSYYAKGLEDSFKKLGHDVTVVPYGNLRNVPSGLSHLWYFFRIFPKLHGVDTVIALDTSSVAIPAWFAAKLVGVRFIIRTGGDFVWEQYVNRTNDLVPLPFFYDEARALSFKEQLAFALTRLILRRSAIVFSSNMQRDLWLLPYGLSKNATTVIENEIPAKLAPTPAIGKKFVMYGRQIPLKNAPAFRRAFQKAKERFADIELDEGMVPHAQLLEKMCASYAAVVPSISEVSPNYVLDSIRCGKPFILTKYSEYAQRFGMYGVLVDPLEESDMQRGIERLADPATYEELCSRIEAFSEVRTYDDITREFLALMSV
jgi:glycosyltransferase involved in cell wall biosynthesis